MIGKIFGEICTLTYANGTITGACRGEAFDEAADTEKLACGRWLTRVRQRYISDVIRSLCQAQGFGQPPPFTNYSAQELAASGLAFQTAISQFPTDDTEERTLAVKFWFYLSMAPGLRVYGRPFDPERGFDQCHTTVRPRLADEGWEDRWEGVFDSPIRLRFALESEWGIYKDPYGTVGLVLDDAWKLAISHVNAKAMVFASRAGQNRERIVESLRRLHEQAGDECPWLWIDWPWDYSGRRPCDIAFGTF